MHKKFEINLTKIKGGCQSGRKVVTHNSKSDLPLVSVAKNIPCLKSSPTLKIAGIKGGESRVGSVEAFEIKDNFNGTVAEVKYEQFATSTPAALDPTDKGIGVGICFSSKFNFSICRSKIIFLVESFEVLTSLAA